jgi:hypothetical protein
LRYSSLIILFFSFFWLGSLRDLAATEIQVGVYYFPGWHSTSDYWRDLRGEKNSRSPGKSWEGRYPILGFYPEEEQWVADKHLEWASSYGINFFAYDWYWDGTKTQLDHAIKNYLQSKGRYRVKFCLMWANAYGVPRNLNEFNEMVLFWCQRYFSEPSYLRIEGQPAVFLFSPTALQIDASRFGESVKSLLEKAKKIAKGAGLPGIYFVAITDAKPQPALLQSFLNQGFSAFTGWNYSGGNKEQVLDYDAMVDTYLSYYEAARKLSAILPYLVPASPGADGRPWFGNKANFRENPTPAKFASMLRSARELAMGQTSGPKMVIIEAWNEFGEGSYVEPTAQWKFQYLETIKQVFGK